MKASEIVKAATSSAKKHAPEILTGLGIVGMVSTTVMAVKATPKALMLIDEAECDKHEPLTKVEKVKVAWKCYIPSVITGVTSVACLVGASSANARRNAALATAYTLSESALREYKDKVVETIGEKKEEEIRSKVAKQKLKSNPVGENQILITDKGNTLCYDTISGRYFMSDMDRLKKAENEINRRLLVEDYISLNELYYEIGLNDTKIGYDLGWNVNKGLVHFNFSSQLAEDGTPCLVLDFDVVPKYNYYE